MEHTHTPGDFARFIADGTTVVTHALTYDRHAELASFVSHRETAREDAFKNGRDTLQRRESFARWARVIQRDTFTRAALIDEWRFARSQEALRDTLTRCTSDVVTLARRSSGIVVLADGTRITLDETTHAREARNALARLVIARRTARRYHDVTLRAAYRGTLTRDGMSLNGTTTRNRLAPLTTALALSDTLVTRDGITTPIFARGVVRHDNGNVSPLDTYNVAQLRQHHGKR